MMQRIFIPLIAALVTLVGCNAHNYSEEEDAAPKLDLTLNLRLPKQLPQYQTVDYVSKAEASGVRYVIALYKSKGNSFEQTPALVFSHVESSLQDRSYSMQVPAVDYHVHVWVDYAYADGSSLYYDAADYTEVSLAKGVYSGNDPARDAFYASEDLSLSFFAGKYGSYAHTIGLQRPNARFEFVATDREQFLKNYASKVSAPVKADISQFTVQVSYPQFMPSTFDLFQERPTDARAGVSFSVPMTVREDGNIGLGFDWVFAGEDDTVVVSLTFYDPAGTYIGTADQLEIPVRRGTNTTVRGSLLTSGASGGVSVNPDFDGSYDIEI